MYTRHLYKYISESLFQGKIIILYGARQVGKTTLVKEILKHHDGKYIDCDQINNRQQLASQDAKNLKSFLGNHRLVVIDEAQRVENIGLNLKIIHDNFPEMQIIATGSSSFDLANKINEPLTGRSKEYLLLPLSIQEILGKNEIKLDAGSLENILRFGLYPNVYNHDQEDAKETLQNIAGNYLYKDILERKNIKKSDQLLSLLQLLALQVGNEVSYHELGQKLQMNTLTVQKYIHLLEKSFVIFRLGAFARNLRNEIGKTVKIYFYDIGILNALIDNFNPSTIRNDIGGLWENLCIVERIKWLNNNRKIVKNYFRRTYDQQEIDYIEEENGVIKAFECKYNETKKTKFPAKFQKTYIPKESHIVNKDNYRDILRR